MEGGQQSTEDSSPAAQPGLTLAVTPWGAFAAGALAIATVALAVTLGRRYPFEQENSPRARGAVGQTLESVQAQPPLGFDELQVDLGTSQ